MAICKIQRLDQWLLEAIWDYCTGRHGFPTRFFTASYQFTVPPLGFLYLESRRGCVRPAAHLPFVSTYARATWSPLTQQDTSDLRFRRSCERGNRVASCGAELLYMANRFRARKFGLKTCEICCFLIFFSKILEESKQWMIESFGLPPWPTWIIYSSGTFAQCSASRFPQGQRFPPAAESQRSPMWQDLAAKKGGFARILLNFDARSFCTKKIKWPYLFFTRNGEWSTLRILKGLKGQFLRNTHKTADGV